MSSVTGQAVPREGENRENSISQAHSSQCTSRLLPLPLILQQTGGNISANKWVSCQPRVSLSKASHRVPQMLQCDHCLLPLFHCSRKAQLELGHFIHKDQVTAGYPNK